MAVKPNTPNGLVERLERKLRRHLLDLLPAAEETKLKKLDLHDLLCAYGTWRGRRIPVRPRRVHLAKELIAEAPQSHHQSALDVLVERIESGFDLAPHQSKSIRVALDPDAGKPHHLRDDLDLLLAEWGVQHLHLGVDVRANGLVSRTGDLVFAEFTDEDAYLIGIYPHGSWALRDVVEKLVRNWSRSGALVELKSVIGFSQHWNDEEHLQLRNAGLTIGLEIDGKFYSPPGQTMTGTPQAVASKVMGLMWNFNDWRAKAPQRLRDQCPDLFCYWLPAIKGGECGFACGEQFVSLGPLP